ncbi:MAG: hypothetical protein IPK26_31410 [Planctomycetes bacterium]|nr:hypothetical protein [Planctomycetota bacterium]
MNSPPLVVACTLSLLLSGATAFWLWHSGEALPAPAPDLGESAAELAWLRAQVAELQRRVDALAAAPVQAVPMVRSDAFALEPRTTPANGPAAEDAHSLLDRYVRSFAETPQGSEYYRLAVEAHVLLLVEPVAALVFDGQRPVAMRQALAAMLARPLFAERMDVIDALVMAALPPGPLELAEVAVASLARIASPRALPGLERVVLQRTDGARASALRVLVELAGAGANAAIARLFAVTSDDALRQLLLRALDGGETLAAGEVLTGASVGSQPVRLAAAKATAGFDDPAIDAMVERWRARETDPAVLAALGAAAAGAASWSAAKATGAPDADPQRDDPNAWAPRSPEMGRQWLQVSFPTAVQAHGVRVFEVNAHGALVEVLGKGPEGGWITLWRGTTAVPGGSPRVLTWSPTAVPIKTLRLVLDTDRTQGWNEIDAVELLGPGGGQWASRATASSTFASQGSNGIEADAGMQLQYRKAALRR